MLRELRFLKIIFLCVNIMKKIDLLSFVIKAISPNDSPGLNTWAHFNVGKHSISNWLMSRSKTSFCYS